MPSVGESFLQFAAVIIEGISEETADEEKQWHPEELQGHCSIGSDIKAHHKHMPIDHQDHRHAAQTVDKIETAVNRSVFPIRIRQKEEIPCRSDKIPDWK